MTHNVLLLPGDGIGPEIIQQAKNVLEIVADACGGIKLHTADVGGCAYDKFGMPLPKDTLDKALAADGVLFGAVGGPQYDGVKFDVRPEAGLLQLRKQMQVYANLRPVKIFEELIEFSNLRPEVINGVDFVIVRELIGGIYFGEPRGTKEVDGEKVAFNTMQYSEKEIIRLVEIGINYAKSRDNKLLSVDKSNVLEVSRLWRETVDKLATKPEHKDVEFSHMLVDNAAMQLVRVPKEFSVIVTSNLFGDILSDLAAELTGSIGMLPSASIGDNNSLYEPIHGTAPTIAGQDIANPCGTILSAAMLVEISLNKPEISQLIYQAVANTLAKGLRTQDLAKNDTPVSCSQMGAEVCLQLKQLLA